MLNELIICEFNLVHHCYSIRCGLRYNSLTVKFQGKSIVYYFSINNAYLYMCYPTILMSVLKVNIVCGGSFRRGKASCGDLDIIITHPDGRRYKIISSLSVSPYILFH